MRQSIGGTWIFQLMILFIGIFTAYIILTLNYSKTIRMKNEMISMLERYEGINENSLQLINDYLKTSGYFNKGVCGETYELGTYGAPSLDNPELEPAAAGEEYYYCVKKYIGTNISKYYQVAIFYRFNLPVLGEISQFVVRGVTTNFVPADDNPSSPYCYAINDTRYGYCGSSPVVNKPVTPTTPTSYTVSFNLNGGSGSFPSQTVNSGAKVTNPGTPTRSGYTFNGWYYGGSSYNFNSPVNGNINLVASWSKNEEPIQDDKVKVTINLNGGSCYSVDCSKTIELEKGSSLYSYLGDPNWQIRKSGYRGDIVSNKSGVGVSSSLYSDVTFTVNWTKTPGFARIYYDANGGVCKSGKCTTGIIYHGLGMGDGTYSSTMTLYNDAGTFTKEGYSFVCWATPDNKCFNFNTPVKAEDTSLHIVWKKN